MYTIETVPLNSRGKLLYGSLTTDHVSVSSHMWSGEEIEISPEVISFQLTSNYIHTDSIPTGSQFVIYSQKFIDLLTQFDIKFQAFDVQISDINGQKIPNSFKIFHLVSLLSYLREREIDLNGKSVRLPLSKRWPQDTPDMFRNQNQRAMVVISDQLRNAIKEQGITGVEMHDIDEYFNIKTL